MSKELKPATTISEQIETLRERGMMSSLRGNGSRMLAITGSQRTGIQLGNLTMMVHISMNLTMESLSRM